MLIAMGINDKKTEIIENYIPLKEPKSINYQYRKQVKGGFVL